MLFEPFSGRTKVSLASDAPAPTAANEEGYALLRRRRKIRASPAGVVLVAWEHRNIPLLAEALGYSDSNPEFKQELEKCHSKLGGWPTDADFDFVYTFSYDTGSCLLYTSPSPRD